MVILFHNNMEYGMYFMITALQSYIDPCLFESSCENILGLFCCICPSGREGHRCQYEIKCNDSSLCLGGDETCVETVANPMGYDCISTPVNQRLHIQLSDHVTVNQINEALYELVRKMKVVKY